MHQINSISRKRPRTVLILALAALASTALAACGSSSNGSSSTAASTSASSTTPTRGAAGTAQHFGALRECLKKNGVTLPQRQPGQAPGTRGLPAGVTRAQFEAAFNKCRGLIRPGLPAGGGRFLRGPVARAALAKFAACMGENGVKLPPANTSGASIFNTRGLNTNSPKFKAAFTKCRGDLFGGFHGPPGAGIGGTSGRPPAIG